MRRVASRLHPLIRWFQRSPDAPPLRDDARSMRRLQWQVFVAITFGYGFFYVCRLSLNVIKKPLIDAGLFDPRQLGMIGSALFFTYAFGRLVNGVLVDHANVKRFMAFGLLASAAINLILGSLPGFWIFVLLWGANGWFQSMGAPASVVAMARWFPSKGRGTVYGVWSTSHNIGEAFTYVVTGAIVTSLGAAWGMRAAGIVGLGAGLLILIALHERPEVHGLPAPSRCGRAATASTGIGHRAAMAGGPRPAHLAPRRSQRPVLRHPLRDQQLGRSSSCRSRRATARCRPRRSSRPARSPVSPARSSRASFRIASSAVVDTGRRCCAVCSSSRRPRCSCSGPPMPSLDTAVMVLFGVTMGALLAYLGGMMALDLVDRRAVGTATAIVGLASYLGAAIQDSAQRLVSSRPGARWRTAARTTTSRRRDGCGSVRRCGIVRAGAIRPCCCLARRAHRTLA